MNTKTTRQLGVLAIALCFASPAHAESQYVTSNLTTGGNFANGIAMNGASEFVLGGADRSFNRMMAAGYDLATFTQKWSYVSPSTLNTQALAVNADSGLIYLTGYIRTVKSSTSN